MIKYTSALYECSWTPNDASIFSSALGYFKNINREISIYANKLIYCSGHVRILTNMMDILKGKIKKAEWRRSNVEELPITTGASDSQRDKGIWCPKINWEAAALKNGSSAAEADFREYLEWDEN